jgi:Helix-turn-helix
MTQAPDAPSLASNLTRLDSRQLIRDFDLIMRVGSLDIVDGRLVRRKWNQRMLAGALGLEPSHLSAIRNGHQRPSANEALAIMGFLDANVNDYLLPLPEPAAAANAA